jgi:hypothetical protein
LEKIPKISGFFNVAPKPQIGLQNPSSCNPVNNDPLGILIHPSTSAALDSTTAIAHSIPNSEKNLEVERPKIKPTDSVEDQYDFELKEKDPIHSPTSAELDTTIAIVHEHDSNSNSDTNLVVESVKPKDPVEDQCDFELEDPASWNIKNESQVNKIISSEFDQNLLQADFSKSEHHGDGKSKVKRKLSVNLFFVTLPNGEKIKRDWLIYSQSTGQVFCKFCLMFQPEDKSTSFSKGFNDWKNSFALAEKHEKSDDHRANVLKFILRKKTTSNVTKQIQSQCQEEVKYWREILTRVVSVVKFLSSRGLPFRGDNQTFGSTSNGLFLGCLELISEFDPFLAQHIATHGNKGKGSVSYLSSDICSEFIEIMSKEVLKQILNEIKQARYFSLIIDSTPDVSHTDQLAVVLRYVSLPNACANERLIQLLPNVCHKSGSLEEATLSLLEKLELDVDNCRGQSYDNASNMSGIYSGLQARIKSKNDLADYVPCAAHSLNLAGCFAAEKACPEATIFFTFVQGLYAFFSASTYRWNILKSHIEKSNEGKSKKDQRKLMVKPLSDTRWSARADALRALKISRHELKDALEELNKDDTQTPETQCTAAGFLKTLGNFQTTLLTVIWDEILERVDKTSKTLQNQDLDLFGATKELETLSSFLSEKRDLFDDFESKALKLAEKEEAVYDKVRKRKLLPDEKKDRSMEETSPRERFRTGVFIAIVDNIASQLNKRREAYKNLDTRFKILQNLEEKNSKEVACEAKLLGEVYKNDIDGQDFAQECNHFKQYMVLENLSKIKEMYAYIKSNRLENTFPNLEVALRIFLTLPVTNCTAERSFSALKRVKSEIRSSMVDEKLNGLLLLCTKTTLL